MPTSLVLGTAQLGFPYGIANKTGQPDQLLATEIVKVAWENGIREFDTAQDYGVSENVLGKAFDKLKISQEAKVISKISPIVDHNNLQAMSVALHTTLEKLGVPCLFGFLLHDENLLDLWSEGIGDILRGMVASGKIEHIGVSVYSPDKATEALSIEGIDLVQLPFNILDRRFLKKGVFELAAKKKKKIYIRSVFLQGLILMEPDDLPGSMYFVKPVIDRIKSCAEDLNITRHELALIYPKVKVPEAKLIIGVEAPSQIKANVNCWGKTPLVGLVRRVEECFETIDEKILNPSLWRT